MRLRGQWMTALAIGALTAGCVAPVQQAGVSSRTASIRSGEVRLNEAEALASVNAYRRGYGLVPVRIDAAVTRAARGQSLAMAQQGVMSHAAGGDFRARLTANGVGRATAVENIAWGHRTFSEAMGSWQSSYSHAANMQSPDMTRLGVAVVNTAGGAYWTLVMAGDGR